MRVAAIFNKDGGTLRTADLDAYSRHVEDVFSGNGHHVETWSVSGKEIVTALRKAAGDRNVDAIVSGGGDGTVSAAAGIAWKSGKILGVLPAGTMNLFARTLGVPLDIYNAAEALAKADIAEVDIAEANGRPFVHQFSVGLQPRIAEERSYMNYGSRVGKMLAGVRAAAMAFRKPPSFHARLDTDDETAQGRYSFLAVSNNPYAPGHMPYADDATQGILGVYSAGVLSAADNVQLAGDLFLGKWENNANLRVGKARVARLHFPHRKRRHKASLDGELVPLDEKVEIRIHAGGLTVLKPQPS